MKSKEKKKKNVGADAKDDIKRLNRVIGQAEGVKKMLAEDRDIDVVLHQCKAVHAALKGVELRLLTRHLEAAIHEIGTEEKKKAREKRVVELMGFYKTF